MSRGWLQDRTGKGTQKKDTPRRGEARLGHFWSLPAPSIGMKRAGWCRGEKQRPVGTRRRVNPMASENGAMVGIVDQQHMRQGDQTRAGVDMAKTSQVRI